LYLQFHKKRKSDENKIKTSNNCIRTWELPQD
jgi:hypothetical protein